VANVLYATQCVLWAAATDATYFCRRGVIALLGAAQGRVLILLASGTRLIEGRRSHPAPQAPIERAPLGIEGQWQRATGSVRAALASFRNIKAFQAAASRQIDAADYALQLLIQDLGAAMPIPADGRELRAVLAEAAKIPVPASRAKKALAA
jgi:hypothetical protein